MSHVFKIFKHEQNNNTIKYLLVLSTTLSIQAEISQKKDKENKTTFSIKSAVIEGKHAPQGTPIDRSQLGKELGLFYACQEIRDFHNAMPFLWSIVGANNKGDSQPPTRKQILIQGFKQRLKNLRKLRGFRLEPAM